MDFLTNPLAGKIGVLVSSHSRSDAGYKALLRLTAVLALPGPVRVLDCGNRPRPERATLVTAVCQVADHVFTREQPPAYQAQPLL